MITNLADRSGSQDYEVLDKLRASAIAYMEQVTKAAFSHIVRLRCDRGSGCGCATDQGSCEGHPR